MKVFWEEKDNKHTFYVEPKAAMMNLVKKADGWHASCLHATKDWPLSTPLNVVRDEAQQWFKHTVLPEILASI